MNSIGVREAKAKLSECLNQAAYGGERIVIISHGKPKAAIIGIDDLRRLEALEDAWDAKLLAEAMATETEFYTLEEVEKELLDLVSA